VSLDHPDQLPLTGLAWIQPSAFARQFELRWNDQTVARLDYQRVFGSLALATWGAENWEFERSGFLHPRVIARRPGGEALARYHPHWTGHKGQLEGPALAPRQWQATNLMATRFSWTGGNGDVLLSIRLRGLVHSGGDLEVTDAGALADDIVLLILLGWYLAQLARQDSAAVVAAG
jgi:hypothetical protein